MTRISPQEAVSDALVMTRRELITSMRRPALFQLAFVQPVIMILLFRFVFGGAIKAPNGSYVNFLVPGILVMTAIFGALVTGVGLSEDLNKGIVDRLRSLPMARSAVLVGRTLSDLVRNVGAVAMMLAVAFLVGFRPSQSLFEFVAAVALVVAFAYVFSWISAMVALLAGDPETAQSFGMLWVFPLTFASSAFVPTHSMPAAIRAFADVNPVTLCVDAVRALMTGGHVTTPVLGTLAWIVGLLVLFVPLTVARYQALD